MERTGTGSSPPEPLEVTTFTATFEYMGRTTTSPEGRTRSEPRTLATDIYVPAGDGPFPLIVHAHGFQGQPARYSTLLATWAAAGHVVAAPTFPLTNDRDTRPVAFDDYVHQPADIAVVIDRMLHPADGTHAVPAGRIDRERIGLSGHSLGGITVYGLAFNSSCRDLPRPAFSAALILNSLPLRFPGGSYDFGPLPLLVMLAERDLLIPYDRAVRIRDRATGPLVLVTMDTDEHSEMYENDHSRFDGLVAEATVQHWRTHLGGDPAAPARLLAAIESTEGAALTALH